MEENLADFEKQVLNPFLDNLPQKLLFLKSIEVIEVYVHEQDSMKMKLLGKVSLDNISDAIRENRRAIHMMLDTIMEEVFTCVLVK